MEHNISVMCRKVQRKAEAISYILEAGTHPEEVEVYLKELSQAVEGLEVRFALRRILCNHCGNKGQYHSIQYRDGKYNARCKACGGSLNYTPHIVSLLR